MPNGHQQTLEQQRAAAAWKNIAEVSQRPEDFKKKYGSLAKKVPSLILTNGLGQTLAFLRAKGKDDRNDEHNVLFQHLSTWTMGQVAPNAGQQSLLDWVRANDSPAYRRATTETLAFLVWLKRFAEAELPTEEE
jgi:CRISPR-associated protein Cmr5